MPTRLRTSFFCELLEVFIADEIASGLKRQQQAGIGRRRVKLEIAVEALLEKLTPLNFASLAAGLGAIYGFIAAQSSLSLIRKAFLSPGNRFEYSHCQDFLLLNLY